MSKRFSTVLRDRIEYSFWLVFDDAGGMRLSRGEPSCGRAERAMQISATLPKALFATPRLSAKIAVAGDVPETTIDITAASEALRGALGVDVDLVVRESAS